MNVFCCAILLLISAIGLTQGRAERDDVPQGPREEISFRPLDHGGLSGITQATNRVIKTEAGWRKIWEKHSGRGVPRKAVPKVDFEKEMVVAVWMGQQPSSGYSVEIKRIEAAVSRLTILVEQTVPGPDAYALAVVTTPFHFVAVRRSDLKPEFVVKE